jgi:surface polysaccharide O-acyltransferase-like enzyme
VWGRKWDGGPGAYRAFLVRRAVVVAVPYLFWVAVYYLLRPSVLGVPWPSGGVLAVVGDSLGRAIDGSAWYHLYFVPMVLVLYVLTPLASRVAHWSPEALVAGMVALAVAWLAFVGDASWAEGPFGNLVHTVVLYAPSAGLGAWLAVRGKPVRRVLVWVWPLLLVGGVYGMWVKGWDRLVYSGGIGPQLLGQLVVFAAVLGVYGLCLLVAGRWRPADRAAESLYATSFGIYLLHPLVLAGLGALVLLRVPARDLLFSRDLLFMWVVVLATTWGAVRLLLLGKWTRWAV